MGQMPAGQPPRSSLLFHSSHILGGVLCYQVWDTCLTEVDTRSLARFLPAWMMRRKQYMSHRGKSPLWFTCEIVHTALRCSWEHILVTAELKLQSQITELIFYELPDGVSRANY